MEMVNELVSIRLSEKLIKEMENVTKRQGFSTVQEFMRESIRLNIEKYKLKESVMKLSDMYGSAKGKKIPKISKKEMDSYIKKITT